MSDEKPRVTIYTDGGADPNPGPGGWAYVLIHDATGAVQERAGFEPATTNNRMEMTAAILALEALKRPCQVRFFTDSQYLKRGITEWVEGWERSGWKRGRSRSQEVENADLWRYLLALVRQHEIEWQWVRGHTGNRYNERADQLASQQIRQYYAAAREEETVAAADAEVYLLVSARGGRGMWAASVRQGTDEELLTGYEVDTTSNRLDVLAAAEALASLPERAHVRMYTPSDYLRNGATMWIKGWKRRNWLKKDGEPVKNQDVWQRLDGEMSRRRVEWPSVKDDPSLELTFEDVGRRAQERFEEMMRENPEMFDEGY